MTLQRRPGRPCNSGLTFVVRPDRSRHLLYERRHLLLAHVRRRHAAGAGHHPRDHRAMNRRCLYCNGRADDLDAFCGNDCEHDYFVSMSDALLEGKPDEALRLAKARIDALDEAQDDGDEEE